MGHGCWSALTDFPTTLDLSTYRVLSGARSNSNSVFISRPLENGPEQGLTAYGSNHPYYRERRRNS